MNATENTVTVYSKHPCVQCYATIRELRKRQIPYTNVDLGEHPELVTRLKAAGYAQAPVVVAGDDSWAGFRPDKIKTLAT